MARYSAYRHLLFVLSSTAHEQTKLYPPFSPNCIRSTHIKYLYSTENKGEYKKGVTNNERCFSNMTLGKKRKSNCTCDEIEPCRLVGRSVDRSIGRLVVYNCVY